MPSIRSNGCWIYALASRAASWGDCGESRRAARSATDAGSQGGIILKEDGFDWSEGDLRCGCR